MATTPPKTVVFCGGSTDSTSVASAVERATSQTVTLPEIGITFLSVRVIWHVRDDNAAAASITAVAMRVRLGLATSTTVTVTDTITNSTEHQTYEFSVDATTHFNSNWSGPSMNLECGLTITGNATCNHSWRVEITYNYNDVSDPITKTIRIPIESTQQILTTAYQSIGGTNQLPILSGGSIVMPEGSITILNAFIELWGNDVSTATTDFTLDLNIPGVGSLTSAYRCEQGLNSATWCRVLWDITSVVGSMTSATQLEARSPTLTSRFEWLCGYVVITYQCDLPVPGVDSTYNSILLAAFDDVGQAGGTAAANRKQDVLDFFIQEPATITMQPSAVYFFYNTPAAGNFAVAVGGQGDRTFTMGTPTSTCGQRSFGQRIDSGGTSGAGITLARGRNTLTTNWRNSANTSDDWNVSGYAIINYISGVAADGVASHNQSCSWIAFQYAADATVRMADQLRTPVFPAEYFLTGAAVECAWISSALAIAPIAIEAQYETGEGPDNNGVGWEPLYFGSVSTDGENGLSTNWGRARHFFRRYAGDVDTERADAETTRQFRVTNPDSIWSNLCLWTTTHSIMSDVAGTVTDYAGDGSGITVNVFRDGTGERILSTTTAVGGTYSVAWYDDTEDLVAECREDATHVGRSDRGTATLR